MKSMTCDFCEKVIEGNNRPISWGTLRTSYRWDGMKGTGLFVLDACEDCAPKYLKIDNAKKEVIQILKARKND